MRYCDLLMPTPNQLKQIGDGENSDVFSAVCASTPVRVAFHGVKREDHAPQKRFIPKAPRCYTRPSMLRG